MCRVTDSSVDSDVSDTEAINGSQLGQMSPVRRTRMIMIQSNPALTDDQD